MLDQDDAVANKVNALYSRAQARDRIDVHAALASGRYTPPRPDPPATWAGEIAARR
ncbi:MAG TPA: hypothetical protein VFP72_14295 [Kineosporiaceae bacterium]|nr:hypothetical protein [Kineosporiaceae bacterium]